MPGHGIIHNPAVAVDGECSQTEFDAASTHDLTASTLDGGDANSDSLILRGRSASGQRGTPGHNINALEPK